MTIAERIMIFGLIIELLAALPAVEADIQGAVSAWHADPDMATKLKDAGNAASNVAAAIANAVEGASAAKGP